MSQMTESHWDTPNAYKRSSVMSPVYHISLSKLQPFIAPNWQWRHSTVPCSRDPSVHGQRLQSCLAVLWFSLSDIAYLRKSPNSESAREWLIRAESAIQFGTAIKVISQQAINLYLSRIHYVQQSIVWRPVLSYHQLCTLTARCAACRRNPRQMAHVNVVTQSVWPRLRTLF